MPQAVQPLRFNLPDPLPCYAQILSDLLKRLVRCVMETEAPVEDVVLPLRKLLDHLDDAAVHFPRLCLLLWSNVGCREHIYKRDPLRSAHWLVETYGWAIESLEKVDPRDRPT